MPKNFQWPTQITVGGRLCMALPSNLSDYQKSHEYGYWTNTR